MAGRNGRNHAGNVMLHDVARAVGVHASTVSRALDPARRTMVREATRQRIIDAVGRLGYRPDLVARGLQTGRTATVGVIVADLGNLFNTPLIHTLTAAIGVSGMMPIIAETEDDQQRFAAIVDHMLSRRVDAIVTAASRSSDREILAAAGRLIPVVVTGRPLPGTSLPQVIHDDRRGGMLVAQHLFDLGHRVVCQLQGPPDVANFPLRARGFSGVCRRNGMHEIPFSKAAVRPILEEGRRLMAALLEQGHERPTAIFVHNDMMALGALGVLRDAGLRVPEDVSVVGYNDLPMVGYLDPPLTTVRYPSPEMGRAAGDAVLQLLAGEEKADVMLKAKLVVRASTRAV